MSDSTDDAIPAPKLREGACPKCCGTLKRLFSRKKKKFYWFCQTATDECGAIYSDADGEPQTTQITRDPVPDLECPACGRGMVYVVGGKYGAFLSCLDRQCGYTIDLRDPSQPSSASNLAPLCPSDPAHGHMRRRKGRNGAFWGCRKFPACRSTREMSGATEHDDDA